MFPDEGVDVRLSTERTDKPKNRLLIERVHGKHGVLLTGIPRIIEAVTECVKSMVDREWGVLEQQIIRP
jgi:hypothetical protein